MTTAYRHTILYLLLALVLLQLAVTLLTYGFSLYDDEAFWHYIGRNWLRHGLVPYSGGADNKSPLIFLIFGISDLLFGVNYWFPRVLGTGVEALGMWYLYRIAVLMAGRRAGILAVSMYGLALLWRSTEGRFVSLTETYEVTCMILAVYYFLLGRGNRDYLISGSLAGLGFAFRLTGIAGMAAIGLFSFQRGWKAVLYFTGGLVLCLVILAGAATLAGIHLSDCWQFAIADNFGGGSFQNRDYPESVTKGFFHSEMILFYPPVLAYFLMKKKIDILFIWLVAGCLCIWRIGYFSNAHLKDILPPLALTAALSIDRMMDTLRLPFKQGLAVIWICWFPKDTEPIFCVDNVLHPVIATPQSYCAAPWSPLDNYSRKKLGLWIKANTGIHDKVYIANYASAILVYTERLCPSIYFSTNEGDRAKKIFYRQMDADKPDLLAVPLNNDYETNVSKEQRDYIRDLTSSWYREDTCMYGYTIYRIQKKRS